MCGLCGVLGGAAHWSSAYGRLESTTPTTLRAERARTVELFNRIVGSRGASVSDWQGTSFVVAGPTGGQEVVGSLALVWPALDRLCGWRLDPLADDWSQSGRPGA